MREILGDAKNIRALLGNAKYAIDYYQREYRWQTKHVTELIDDLAQVMRDASICGLGHTAASAVQSALSRNLLAPKEEA